MDENKNPGLLTENEVEEFELLSGMILDTVEEGDEETIHGFCY
jgi:hypothetical protein